MKAPCLKIVFNKNKGFPQLTDELLTQKKPKVFHYAEAVSRRCYVKKVFLKIPQNSQENTLARVSFLMKLQA